MSEGLRFIFVRMMQLCRNDAKSMVRFSIVCGMQNVKKFHLRVQEQDVKL